MVCECLDGIVVCAFVMESWFVNLRWNRGLRTMDTSVVCEYLDRIVACEF